ncbi:MAG: FHA domain-containing protein [Planctomicrobium sp.]|nr:FHA domain-containing protein [Planctomicrobium sp.]
MPMILVSLEDGASIVLNKAVMFFGRGNECDIILNNSRKVSRKHCCVAQIDEDYVVRDLGSMNGVRVNERKADPELPLQIGDELWVGDVGYRFQPHDGKNGTTQPKAEISEKPEEKKLLNPAIQNMDKPVPLPEEGKDLVIEESIQQKILGLDDGTFD